MKKAILIVSFGTTYPETRQKNITAITRQVRALYPDAFSYFQDKATSGMWDQTAGAYLLCRQSLCV